MRKLAVPANTHNQYEEECVKTAKLLGNFDQNAFNKRRKIEHEEYLEVCQYLDKHQSSSQQPNIPHCPTCNSTNIKRISMTSKAIGIGLFGIFGKTSRSQFECKDCGYKW